MGRSLKTKTTYQNVGRSRSRAKKAASRKNGRLGGLLGGRPVINPTSTRDKNIASERERAHRIRADYEQFRFDQEKAQYFHKEDVTKMLAELKADLLKICNVIAPISADSAKKLRAVLVDYFTAQEKAMQ